MLYSQSNTEQNYFHLPGVGGMGFASSFAIGASQADPDRNVYCIDGDGSFFMHGLSNSVAPLRNTKFRHIVLKVPQFCRRFCELLENGGFCKDCGSLRVFLFADA